MDMLLIAFLFFTISIGIIMIKKRPMILNTIFHEFPFQIGLQCFWNYSLPRVGKSSKLKAIVEYTNIRPLYSDVLFIGSVLIHDGVDNGFFGHPLINSFPLVSIFVLLFN